MRHDTASIAPDWTGFTPPDAQESCFAPNEVEHRQGRLPNRDRLIDAMRLVRTDPAGRILALANFPKGRWEMNDAPKQRLAPMLFAVHTWPMRANVNLDADVYTFALTYASAKGIPLGAAISELLRRAEQAPEPASMLLTESRLALLVRAKRNGDMVVTPEMVKELSEEDLE